MVFEVHHKKDYNNKVQMKKKPRKGVGGFTPRNLHIHHSHLEEEEKKTQTQIKLIEHETYPLSKGQGLQRGWSNLMMKSTIIIRFEL